MALLAAGDKLRNVLKQLGGFVCAGPDRRLMIAGQPFFHALEGSHNTLLQFLVVYGNINFFLY